MRRVLLIVFLMALIGPARAAATQPDTIVDFERVPAGAPITDQYVSPEGVEFGTPEQFGLPSVGSTCTPKAQDGGIDGRSANIACEFIGNGDVTNPNGFTTAFEFRETRRHVSFELENTTPEDDSRESADVRFYAPGGQLLNQQTVAFPSATTPVLVQHSEDASRIAAVRIVDTQTDTRFAGDVPPVFLDDIDATKDDTPPAPVFALALLNPSVSAYEGAVATAALSVRRFNGSTGAVNLAVTGGLDSGINGVQFDPNPVTGSNPTTMRISTGRPFTGTHQITVRATGGSADAGTAATGDLTQTVIGQPDVTLDTQSPASLYSGCGFQKVNDSFTVHGGYTGTVAPGFAAGTGNGFVPDPSVAVNGDGTYPFSLLVSPDKGAPTTYGVTATPDGATPASATRSFTVAQVQVDSAVGSSGGGSIPRPLTGGATAVVTGDLPVDQCALTFVDEHGVTWPIIGRSDPIINGRHRDQLTLQIPPLATSGPLKVMSGTSSAQVASTPSLDITDFRNVDGSSVVNDGPNAGAPDYTWEDFRRTFGDDDVDRCFLGMCGRDPVAEDFHDKFRADVRAYGGSCAGFVIMALRFFGLGGAVQKPSDYQAGAQRPWDITDTADGTSWKRDLIRWQVAQNDADFTKTQIAALTASPAAKLSALHAMAANHSADYIDIRQGTDGHAVVAYAVQDNVPPQAGEVAPVTLVRVYDPNLPYLTAEETDGNVQSTDQGMSTIRIDADGNWSGASFPWKGPNDTIGVVGVLPPEDASLPVQSFLFVFHISNDGSAAPTAISADGKPALGAGGEPKPGSGVTLDPLASGTKPEPRYELAPGHTYTATMRGQGSGQYTQGQYSRKATATVTASTANGQQDKLTITPGSPKVGFATGAAKTAVTYDVADQAGKGSQGARIATTATKGGDDRVALDGTTVQLAHQGPATTATMTLSSAGDGLPAAVTTAPLRVGSNQRLQVRPRTWADLGAGARYVVRNAHGHVVRRGRVRLRRSKAVALGRVRAKLRKGVVTVSGKIAKAGSAPLLAAEVTFTRHGKVVERRAGTLAKVHTGTFSLPVKVGTAPHVTKAHVTVTLSDQSAATGASVRRTAKVRR